MGNVRTVGTARTVRNVGTVRNLGSAWNVGMAVILPWERSHALVACIDI
jgi:hypothetical protein